MEAVKPYLISVPVPWRLSTQYTSMPFCVVESNDKMDLKVQFKAYLGGATGLPEDAKLTYRQVEAILRGCVYVNMYPSDLESQITKLDSYDWSRIPEFRDECGSLNGAIERERNVWISSGVCPNPRVYEIVKSHLSVELNDTSNAVTHFAFVTGEFVVEVVAERFDWRFA